MVHNEDKLTFDHRQAHSDALAALRKESLDIYNRLHSIEDDIGFVNQVNARYPDFPLLPNLRCGAWYTDPTLASETPAYFKSTDGHTGNWCFNLRRGNLHLLSLIAQKSGLVLVDSTRAGKRMPDALSKTVPIWCTVVNRAILLRRQQRYPGSTRTSDWDVQLYTPPGVVSAQEHDQIVSRLDVWTKALADSSFDLPLELPAPLRPLWITPATTTFPVLDTSSPSPAFFPVICLSASKQVEAGTERRVAGYAYVQGSGDDHELWGMGLTPQTFWKYRTDLIASSHADLENLIKQILSSPPSRSHPSPTASRFLESKPFNPVPIKKINGRIQLGSFCPFNVHALLSSLLSMEPEGPSVTYVILDFSPPSTNPDASAIGPGATDGGVFPKNILHIAVSPKGKAKLDTHFLQHILPAAIPFIKYHLSSQPPTTIYILEGRGNAPETRLDMSVGLAVTAIKLFFDQNGAMLREDQKIQADKQSIRTRLEWVIESEPRANPSRATLKRVNEFLLTSPIYLTHPNP